MKLCSVCAEREIDNERDDEGRDLCRSCLRSWWRYCSNFVTGSYQRWVRDRLETLRRQRALRAAEEVGR